MRKNFFFSTNNQKLGCLELIQKLKFGVIFETFINLSETI